MNGGGTGVWCVCCAILHELSLSGCESDSFGRNERPWCQFISICNAKPFQLVLLLFCFHCRKLVKIDVRHWPSFVERGGGVPCVTLPAHELIRRGFSFWWHPSTRLSLRHTVMWMAQGLSDFVSETSVFHGLSLCDKCFWNVFQTRARISVDATIFWPGSAFSWSSAA